MLLSQPKLAATGGASSPGQVFYQSTQGKLVNKTGIYLRPVGRLVGALARGEEIAGEELVLNSRPNLKFSAIELIERQGEWTGNRTFPVDEIFDALVQSQISQNEAHAILHRVLGPRADLAGLTLDRTRIMGIVNVTPDSFSDGGQFSAAEAAIEHAMKLDEEGADIIDIGGESTRPGAGAVSLEDEIARVMPVIEGLRGKVRARISVDTRKSEIMRRAAAAGVDIINDVSALRHDPKAMRVIADTGMSVVLMHALADPKTMQDDPRYENVLLDVYDTLEERIAACEKAGIGRERIIVDPGIGFGKTVDHNLTLLGGMGIFHGLGTAVALGASRKSFIGTLTGAVDPVERMPGSLAAAMVAVLNGVQILRVHDVAATRQALSLFEAAVTGTGPAGS